jgi:pimeloyl-ACP methyl ester carboxylesterase
MLLAMVLRLARYAARISLRLAGGRPVRCDAGCAELLCWRFGPADGEPWLLLHGLASSALAWRPVVPRLAAGGCRLVVPELSALGDSVCPDGGLAVSDGVEAAATLIERELGGGPVTVAGQSLGGWMAVRLALARPDLVSRLVLVDAGGYRDQDWDRIEELVTVTEPAHVEPLYDALFQRVPTALNIGRGVFYRAYSSPVVRAILSKLRIEDTYDDRDLARLHQPAALIWGEHDGLFTFATAERMAAALPRARLYKVAGCGHALQWECPEALADAVAEFHGATAGRPGAASPAPAGPPA